MRPAPSLGVSNSLHSRALFLQPWGITAKLHHEESASNGPAPDQGAQHTRCCFSFSSMERESELHLWGNGRVSPVVLTPTLAMEDFVNFRSWLLAWLQANHLTSPVAALGCFGSGQSTLGKDQQGHRCSPATPSCSCLNPTAPHYLPPACPTNPLSIHVLCPGCLLKGCQWAGNLQPKC